MNDLRLSKGAVALCLGAVVTMAGCHKKTAAAPPPPPPAAAPAPAPSAQIRVSPSVIEAGQTATLSWTTANASGASISGIGTVATSGSQTVTPSRSEDYTLTANGAGGSTQQTARLTVNQPKPAPVASLTEQQMFDQNMQDTYFDYDKYDLNTDDGPVAQKDASFLVQHPNMKILIAGHCDERGSEEYNIALGQNRAQSLEKALENNGVAASRIRVISYGKEKPFCSDSDEACWHQNRRDHVTLDQ